MPQPPFGRWGFFMSGINLTQRGNVMNTNSNPLTTPLQSGGYIAEDLPLITYANNTFQTDSPMSLDQLCRSVALILEQRFKRETVLTTPALTSAYLIAKLANYEREVFSCIYLDNQHGIIAYEELFYGTIDGASVYPREIVKSCLKHNSAAVIFAHNHPSGTLDPSQADKAITERLKTALATVDIRVLDHVIVGGSATTSFAEKGLI